MQFKSFLGILSTCGQLLDWAVEEMDRSGVMFSIVAGE